ncbi:MAG: hypothetical protein JO100_00505 [Pseudonocardia sp.]|jgi:hypothetical protein|nr:hypothetical protein [Pseudonocardia sp.]
MNDQRQLNFPDVGYRSSQVEYARPGKVPCLAGEPEWDGFGAARTRGCGTWVWRQWGKGE